MLLAEGIRQGYGTMTVLDAVDVELREGVTALLGPNGAGKTTLLETLATVRPHRGGRLNIAGIEVNSERTARSARRHIGYLPQRPPFDPGMRLQDFVLYSAWIRGVPPGEWTSAARDTLEYVGLTDMARRRLRTLSGGMRQRAAIAWALVGRPSLVLLDEPTVGLDPEQRFRFRRLVAGLAPAAVLLSTHLTDDVDAICARVLVIDQGTITFRGTCEALKARGEPSAVGHTSTERGYMSVLQSAGGAQ